MLRVIKTTTGLAFAYPDSGEFQLRGKRVSSWSVRQPTPAELKSAIKVSFAIQAPVKLSNFNILK